VHLFLYATRDCSEKCKAVDIRYGMSERRKIYVRQCASPATLSYSRKYNKKYCGWTGRRLSRKKEREFFNFKFSHLD
jgi:hypothetical protein